MRLDYDQLGLRLKARTRAPTTGGAHEPAGVTIPLYDKGGETHLLFTLRTDKVKHHKGQISFPGGAAEVADGSIFETAIRETVEEVGVPVGHIHVIGPIDDIMTISGFCVTPVVVRLDHPFPIDICRDEIAELIEVPLAALVAPGVPRIEQWDMDEQPVEMYFYDYGAYTIWGATGRILRQFLGIARECMAPGP